VLKLVPALSAQVPVTAPNMNAQNVSNSLWAAATLSEAGLDLQEMVPALLAQIGVVAKSMKPQELTNSLWATATLKIRR
jgi:UDP-N-acetylmuramyl pentapeptide synthase